MFNDKKYARSIWTEDKVQILEKGWNEQQEYWYDLLRPLVPSGNHSAIDVGCGVGMYYDLLSEKARNYAGIDPSEDMISRARERRPDGKFRIGTVYNIHYPSNHFDLVFCWSVLVHLPFNTIERAIEELWRVTGEFLVFNLYIALEDDSFSVKGPWEEWLTAMNSFQVMRLLDRLKPEKVDIADYEEIDLLDNKRFQRKIFLLKRN